MSQLSTFHVGQYLFGVDVALVQEVVRLPLMTPVPLAAPEIAGLINLRGQVLTAINLRTRLGIPKAEGGREPVNVVVNVGDEPVSLQVDEIGAVLDVGTLPFEQTPTTVNDDVRDLILGAYTLPDKLLLALDVSQVLQLADNN
jgi:purine-binding chemotaxis protein CheW